MKILHVNHAIMMHIMLQILRVVNPSITYTTEGTRKCGIAVNIKGFLALLEEYAIPHPAEKIIRATLPRLSLTSGKQYFLAAKYVGIHKRIDRRENSECRACVCVPQEAITNDFFKVFAGNYMNNNYVLVTTN